MKQLHKITVLPARTELTAVDGTNLLEILRASGLAPSAPCGGQGTCGKCRVKVDGTEVLACKTEIHTDMTVTLPAQERPEILLAGQSASVAPDPVAEGYLIAADIGTTTVVCFLLSPTGEELAVESMLNPQSPYGADVISRIQRALAGDLQAQTDLIRRELTKLIRRCCDKAGISPAQIGVVSVVGNPCMQQLFLGISPANLAGVPFAPVLTRAEIVPADPYLPLCANAKLLIVPDIAGYVGADTMGCVLASAMYDSRETVLMVDIGTNGEMVLAHGTRMTACSTAAGPALEGANIRFGMRGAAGAIDHVWLENGELRCSVIGGGEAKGICGSGLIDAVAVFLELGKLNKRGRIQSTVEVDGQRVLHLTEHICLTQDDIRQVQPAKGAIAAGIHLMCEHLGITAADIEKVLLAGAFGSFLNPESACRIGLLPEELAGKISAAGNIAGSGAKLMAISRQQFELSNTLLGRIEFIELAERPAFQKTFAKNMSFRE